MFRWIICPVMTVCQDVDLIFLIALLVVLFSRPWTSHAGWIWCFRSKMQTDIILRPLPHYHRSFKYSTARTTSLALSKIQKWVVERGDFGNWIKIWFFRKFWLKAHYYPAYYIMADWPDWTVPSNNEFFIPSVLCCCYFYNLLWKGSKCFDRPEYWMSGICLVKRKKKA